jgi:hypothetical protein
MATTIVDVEDSAVRKGSVDEPTRKIPAPWLRKTAIYAAVILSLAPLALGLYLLEKHTHIQVSLLSLLNR